MSLHTLLIVTAVVAFVWGLERWRNDAARRAGRAERARLTVLVRCLLGADGLPLLRSPAGMRRRLRTLAMATPAEGSSTWLDRCIPLAEALARHAGEVDDTGAPTSAQTRVAQSARGLARAVQQVGLVWRIRSGDPETDMDPIAERLAGVAAEIDLADSPRAEPGGTAGPVAPPESPLPEGALVPTPGLEPTPIGSPSRFFVGAPLPSVTEVVHQDDAWRTHTLANEPSVAWHAGGASVARIDAPLDPSDDGLASLRLLRPGDAPVAARVTPVNDPREGLHVALDAVAQGRALWLAQWTPWGGAVLGRFVSGRAATALTLAQAPPQALARATDATREPTTAFDEHVALAPLGDGAVVVAYTRQRDAHAASVVLASTRGESDRAPVARLFEGALPGLTPELEFCERPGGGAVLLAATRRAWLALFVTAAGAREVLRVDAPSDGAFDARLVVQCAPRGMVAYAREHPRASPVVHCREGHDGAPECRAVRAPQLPLLATLPGYTTRTPTGRALLHAEWPMVFADADGTLVAARAAGPVVSIARRAPGAAWTEDRVVFDAAARTHGGTVQGLGVYAEAAQVTLAMATPDGLHLLASSDAGAHWR